jgi:nicotinic acid phosphoribosyltransferase
MKLVILILANDTNEYLKMQMLWKLYMNKFQNVKSFFIKYKSDLQENIVLCDDTIYIKGLESFIPGCLDKTIQSIEFLLKNNDFDFLLIDIEHLLYAIFYNQISNYIGNTEFSKYYN